jgi:hypothetical protein
LLYLLSKKICHGGHHVQLPRQEECALSTKIEIACDLICYIPIRPRLFVAFILLASVEIVLDSKCPPLSGLD